MLKNNLRRGGIGLLQGEICPAASKKLTHFLIAPTVYSSTIMQNSSGLIRARRIAAIIILSQQ